MTKAFISYSWDNEFHKAWVRELASRLRRDGIDVILDQWHLVPGDQVPAFMERAVRESNFVLIVCTRRYKHRSDSRAGGVGYEGDIMSGEVITGANQRKFIPILREAPWEASSPTWLAGKYFVDLSQDPQDESQYQDLLTTLLGTRPAAPAVVHQRVPATSAPTGRDSMESPTSAQPTAPSPPLFEPIKIAGVIVDEVGIPRADGTRGSALYDVPFRLSRRPPPEWIDVFVATWNSPPRFTAMHRPGIASVSGDVVHLHRTTMDEVRTYHRDTLILAAEEANRSYGQLLASRVRQEELERQGLEQHKRDVEEKAKSIKFD